MSLDEQAISYVVRNNALSELQRAGITEDDFVDEFRTVWRYLLRTKRERGTVPSRTTIKHRYPDISLPRVESRDVPIILHDLRQRRKYSRLLTVLMDTAQNTDSFEEVDEAIQSLQSALNSLSVVGRNNNHLVDLMSPEVSKRIRRELRKRQRAENVGFPTGLPQFDNIAGGLQKQKMVVIIGRTGNYKSWLNLLFTASSVINGARAILYPLEMNLFDTAARLYTIFSSEMFGADRAIKNFDLTTGNVNMRKVARFLAVLEDKFKGQLYVADMASLADPYTNERIEAEVEMHKPDIFWVDYLTLLKPPGGRQSEDWQAVRHLSNGIKSTAMRLDVVGGCSAQVSREAIRVNSFLPRLEHIAYADAIGQDADQVFSIKKNSKGLWYALVKNRGGPEIGKTLIEVDLNRGRFREKQRKEDDDD